MNPNPGVLEVHKPLNNIYDFKWIIYLSRLTAEVRDMQTGKSVLNKLLVTPLFATIAAQDQAIRVFEEQYRKNAVLETGKNFGANSRLGASTKNAINEGFGNAIKEEEARFQRGNEAKRKENEEKKNVEQAGLKRKQIPIPELEKKVKPNVVEEYKETEIEAKRRRELEAKLNKKKDKKKLDFL